jgi:hypothetical protein
MDADALCLPPTRKLRLVAGPVPCIQAYGSQLHHCELVVPEDAYPRLKESEKNVLFRENQLPGLYGGSFWRTVELSNGGESGFWVAEGAELELLRSGLF